MSEYENFKTPLPKRNMKQNLNTGNSECYTPHGGLSDSHESISSASSKDLTVVLEFDDYARYFHLLLSYVRDTQNAIVKLIDKINEVSHAYFNTVDEVTRLNEVIAVKSQQCVELESTVNQARKIIDRERITAKNLRKERDELREKVAIVQEIFCNKENFRFDVLPTETKNRLSFLNEVDYQENINPNRQYYAQPLDTIKEINSTGSMLSDLSYSRSEESLEGSYLRQSGNWKKHRPSSVGVPEPCVKKPRSSATKIVEINTADTVRATTTLTVTKDGPVKATSIIESVPPVINDLHIKNLTSAAFTPKNLCESPIRNLGKNLRPHIFDQKIIVLPESCNVCEKRFTIGRHVLKCKECKGVCHIECKDLMPLPCYATSIQRHQFHGAIGDYTPTTPPMVPAILVYCINEIEMRGLKEVGLYRVPGAERDVKLLKEKFLRGKGAPNLNGVDLFVICGTVKDFLRNLSDSIITFTLWQKFVNAAERDDNEKLLQVISELPRPNRDTLAYMIIHLQNVAASVECKMPIGNLAKVFGPTIVGYSCKDPDPESLLNESRQQIKVMECLLNIPCDFWMPFINFDNEQTAGNGLQQTPSTDSLLRQGVKRSFFNVTTRSKRRYKNLFPSPLNN